MRMPLLASAALVAALAPYQAGAHELQTFLSTSGMDVLEQAIPTLVPETSEGLEFEKVLFECSETKSVKATQTDTTLNIQIHDLVIDVPQDDKLRLEIELSLSGNGTLELENPYACFGEATCNNDFFLQNVRAELEFNIEIIDGKPSIDLHNLELDIANGDMDFNVTGCSGIDSVLSWLADFSSEYLLEIGTSVIEQMAVTKLSPMLDDAMVGFSGVQSDFDKYAIDAQLLESDISIGGLLMRGDIDIYSRFSPASCIDSDPGEPKPHDGPAPILDMSASHIGIVANYGLIDDAMYHAWRRGMMCISDKTLEEFGLDTHHMMEEVAKLLPGFPAGTEYGIEVRMAAPPRVRGSAAVEGGLSMIVEGLGVDVIGHKPNGSAGKLHLELDLSMDLNIGVDPAQNVLRLSFGASSIDRLVIDDQIAAAEAGFDAARIRRVVGDFMMPAILEEMSGMPMMAPVFGAGGLYIILKDTDLGQAHLSAQIDLFAAPKDDDQAPDTELVSKPDGITNPHDAVISFTGSDDKIPEQLLQFQVVVDGVAAEPSFVKSTKVGIAGETKTYSVAVSALDLNGNMDQTPITLEVLVDGIAPGVAVRGARVREVDASSERLEWTAQDDTSDASKLAARVELFRINDKTDFLSAQLIETQELPNGATSASVPIKNGDLYRAEIVVTDEGGNETRTSVTLRTPGHGGCSTGGSSQLPWVLGLSLLALALRPRRQRQR